MLSFDGISRPGEKTFFAILAVAWIFLITRFKYLLPEDRFLILTAPTAIIVALFIMHAVRRFRRDSRPTAMLALLFAPMVLFVLSTLIINDRNSIFIMISIVGSGLGYVFLFPPPTVAARMGITIDQASAGRNIVGERGLLDPLIAFALATPLALSLVHNSGPSSPEIQKEIRDAELTISERIKLYSNVRPRRRNLHGGYTDKAELTALRIALGKSGDDIQPGKPDAGLANQNRYQPVPQPDDQRGRSVILTSKVDRSDPISLELERGTNQINMAGRKLVQPWLWLEGSSVEGRQVTMLYSIDPRYPPMSAANLAAQKDLMCKTPNVLEGQKNGITMRKIFQHPSHTTEFKLGPLDCQATASWTAAG